MPDLLRAVAARAPHAVVGWRGNEAITVAAFLARVAAWRALAARSAGRNVALYHEDSLEFSAALLAAWDAGKTVWLCADTLAPSCASLAERCDALWGQFPPQWPALTPQAGESRAPDGAAPPSPALVVHTSGSTGEATAIAKRAAQLLTEVATHEILFGADLGGAVFCATVSHQHIYGLLFKVLWPLSAGRPMAAEQLRYPEEMAVALARRPSVLVASPAHLKRLPEQIDFAPARACLRRVFSSGGPLPPEAAQETQRLLGQRPIEIYGSSETGGVAWRQDEDAPWQAMPGVRWRVDAADQLAVRSPHLAEDAWMVLADRARARGETHFQLLGRSDRIVKIEEKRISLDAVEAALRASGLVREARVLLAPRDGRDALAAFVVLSGEGRSVLGRSGKQGMRQRLLAGMAGAIEPVAMPRRWRYLDSFPCDAQGKTSQASLLALLASVPRLPQVRLIEEDAARVLLELTVPPELLYVDGHFAGAPILPGVVQVDWAILYGRRHFALPPRFHTIHKLKFQNVIVPNQPVQLELLHDAAAGSLAFRYFSAAGQHAGGRIVFGAPWTA